jgi:uncharacterized membrane protein (DUF2068 family)
MDAAHLRPEDAVVAREEGGVRWLRCLRCDSWLPLPLPARPAREHPPERDEIALPLRGRPLRDRIVLRLIAIDRALHFLAFAAAAVAILLLASHEAQIRRIFTRLVADLQGTAGGPAQVSGHGLAHDIERLLTLRTSTLHLVALVVAAYAVLEGVEAVGLWYQKRWAEYLTLIATVALLPLEIYELTLRVTPFKIVALVINVAVVVYLLLAKRLFGLRGGAAADRAERERDVGWEALERTAPRFDARPVTILDHPPGG